jgi:hypothetical protein
MDDAIQYGKPFGIPLITYDTIIVKFGMSSVFGPRFVEYEDMVIARFYAIKNVLKRFNKNINKTYYKSDNSGSSRQ